MNLERLDLEKYEQLELERKLCRKKLIKCLLSRKEVIRFLFIFVSVTYFCVWKCVAKIRKRGLLDENPSPNLGAG